METLRKEYPEKTVARIIYEIEIQKPNPTFRNHDNYNYMIRREYIREEIEKIVLSQMDFGLFAKTFDVDTFIKELISTIDDQKDSTNDLSLFGNCEYYPEEKVAHQYSLLSDIFKMYQSVTNITFGKTKISKEQIKIISDDFFKKIKQSKNIADIKYQDIRKLLKLKDEVQIFGKEDYRLDKKGKKVHYTITKFHFLANLGKIDNSFMDAVFEKKNKYEILKEIFDVLEFEKAPKSMYTQINAVFMKYTLVEDERLKDETIINLIKYKTGSSLNISAHAMIKFIPYFEKGMTLDEIKKELNIKNFEDYSEFKKGIKYLGLGIDKKLFVTVEARDRIKKYPASQFEFDNQLIINNHPVKYVVSATMRLVKHLHVTYGAFDEIRVESTRELSQNEETKKAIDKANRENEAKFQKIIEDEEYQKIAKHYNKNLKRYARKIMLWEEQDKIDIYSGKVICFEDIFTNVVDIDHIIPESLGGLSVKHNLVLAHRDENVKKSNQLPMNFVTDKVAYVNRIEHLYKEYKINWKKKINLLAETLDDGYKDTFESKSLRATSYIEALTAQMLKRYYPFPDKKKQVNGQAVAHVQGRATSNIRKLLGVKIKVRDTNIHHAIDAILIGLTSKSWLQKLSNTFRENMGVIDDEARAKINKELPLIEGVEPKELVELIEDAYNVYGEDSVFYKDIFGKTKAVNFWVSKKSDTSSLHKETIYGIDKIKGKIKDKQYTGLTTLRIDIIKRLKDAQKKPTLPKIGDDAHMFLNEYQEELIKKLYVYQYNQEDKILAIIQAKASDIAKCLEKYSDIKNENKDLFSKAKEELSCIIDKPLVDYNGNIIRKVKIIVSNKEKEPMIRGGTTVAERIAIGFSVYTLEKDKLLFRRIDLKDKLSKSLTKVNASSSMNIFRNDLIYIIFKKSEKNLVGYLESFDDKTNKIRLYDARFPKRLELQPKKYKVSSGKSRKEFGVGSAMGFIKINLDILGNIKSHTRFGEVSKEVEAQIFHKE